MQILITPKRHHMGHVVHGNRRVKLNVCTCGKLHFTYGPITLHFDRDEFQVFAEVVGKLAAQIPYSEDHPASMIIAATKPDLLCH